MEIVQYSIDENIHNIKVDGSPEFFYGNHETLSGKDTDISFGQNWYDEGHTSLDFLDKDEFAQLLGGLTNCISNILSKEIGEIPDFKLNKYHEYVTTDELHYKTVGITRDLFPEDFNFPIEKMHKKLSDLLGFELTDINPADGKQLHIILRINRPGSTDYNPPHKDIYEGVDGESRLPMFVNFWIPICGVTENSSLPIVAKSHLLPESQILRTVEGGVVEGKKYRVRSIKEWGGNSNLTRAKVSDGQVLIFSSHLVHGLAINEENQTRVALEFRLYKK
jgi:hypothetical protein